MIAFVTEVMSKYSGDLRSGHYRHERVKRVILIQDSESVSHQVIFKSDLLLGPSASLPLGEVCVLEWVNPL